MDKALLKAQQSWIKEELDRSAAFWIKNGWDGVNGGVYTCLEAD